MSDTPESGDLDPVAPEPAENASTEDRTYDNFEDALLALGDDDEEQPDESDVEEAEAETEDEADSEADSEADEPDDDESEGEDDEVDGDAEITLPGGETITVSQLEGWRAGGLRQADYTQKTTELAREREAVETLQKEYGERREFVEGTLNKLTEYLQGLIPEEPPLSLAQQDPSQYQWQKAMRESAIAEIGKVLQVKKDVEEHKGEASEGDQKRYVEDEKAKLVKAMPHLSDPARMDAFRKSAVEAAVDEFGFSQQEADATHDARVLQLVHYARKGKLAERNRNNAKRRVETPKQGKPKTGKPQPDQKNREAMRRLSKTGSIDDALSVDF